MNVYLITSSKISGYVELVYREGLLFSLKIDTHFDAAAIAWILQHLSPEENGVHLMQTDTNKIEKIAQDLSFDAFWNAYNYKVDKIDAEKLWKKMDNEQRMAALKSIRAYDHFLAAKGQAKLYPSTYLAKERYRTNWNTLR